MFAAVLRRIADFLARHRSLLEEHLATVPDENTNTGPRRPDHTSS